jgi:hypothetical protein
MSNDQSFTSAEIARRVLAWCADRDAKEARVHESDDQENWDAFDQCDAAAAELVADMIDWATRTLAGETKQATREPRIVPTNDSGALECECGSDQIQELGQIAPGGLWWYHVGQDPDSRTLQVGGWEWEGADGCGFECRDCHAEYDQLPEGWEVDYV